MEKESIKHTRQIIDDCYQPGEVPHCALEESVKSENERLNWHNANRRFAACAAMYEWLDKQGILKKESFCYDVIPERMIDNVLHNKQINFAIDSKDLIKYRDQMLASGVKDADIATAFILGEDKNIVRPSIISGAVCLTWMMQTYRDSNGCVGRSWETTHERYYYLDSQTGIGETSALHREALRKLESGEINEEKYFEMIKNAISLIYKRDRTVYLSKVPASFVRETKNPDYLTVSLPYDKSKSDDGRLRLTVKTSDVINSGYSKRVINIGDVESSVKVSVKKNGQWEHPAINALELSQLWTKNRKEYAKNYKAIREIPVDIKGVELDNIENIGTLNGKYAKPQSKVVLPDIGIFYTNAENITKSETSADIHFNYGLSNIRVYTYDDNEKKEIKYFNAYDLSKLWENQQIQNQNVEKDDFTER